MRLATGGGGAGTGVRLVVGLRATGGGVRGSLSVVLPELRLLLLAARLGWPCWNHSSIYAGHDHATKLTHQQKKKIFFFSLFTSWALLLDILCGRARKQEGVLGSLSLAASFQLDRRQINS